MKIKTMTATFGKLQGERLTLEPGLNVITAPNEGGKSTWCAFLKAMFYGIDTRDRDRKGHLADKNRYQPWSGAPMEGEITLEWQGQDITIRRGPRGNVPFGSFSAVYTGTEEPVPGLTADTCGQMLLGVGREVFERSAFIGQSGTLAIRSAPELEARIAALVSSGKEDVSYSQVERQLKEWLNRRKVNKSVGRIPQLEEEQAELARSAGELSQLNDQLNQLEGERAQAARKHAFCTRQLALHKAIAQRKLDLQYTQARNDEAQAQAQLNALLSEQARFGPIPSRDALKRAQGELAFLKALEPEIRQGQEELALAQQALEQGKAPFARELLEQAGTIGQTAPYCTVELENRRLRLLAQVPGTRVQLPSLDAALLVPAGAAVTDGDWDRARSLLEAVRDKRHPRWNLLRGEIYWQERSYIAAKACYHAAEERYPKETAHRLEQCYRELGDFKRAYEYACKQR